MFITHIKTQQLNWTYTIENRMNIEECNYTIEYLQYPVNTTYNNNDTYNRLS